MHIIFKFLRIVSILIILSAVILGLYLGSWDLILNPPLSPVHADEAVDMFMNPKTACESQDTQTILYIIAAVTVTFVAVVIWYYFSGGSGPGDSASMLDLVSTGSLTPKAVNPVYREAAIMAWPTYTEVAVQTGSSALSTLQDLVTSSLADGSLSQSATWMQEALSQPLPQALEVDGSALAGVNWPGTWSKVPSPAPTITVPSPTEMADFAQVLASSV